VDRNEPLAENAFCESTNLKGLQRKKHRGWGRKLLDAEQAVLIGKIHRRKGKWGVVGLATFTIGPMSTKTTDTKKASWLCYVGESWVHLQIGQG